MLGFCTELWKADFKEELQQELERAKERWIWHVWNPQIQDVQYKDGVWQAIFTRYSSP